ncbi:hypothetical protein DFQ27_001507 [Actinomortierella ambigua]|uniref:FAD-binding PCMH-type domain-containing protein n=1 Tax=Actinomortierella ambigua TaxID=1343610 RepID=A0A9P6QDS9_9FUNG|nr:hypothetical protein DFQ27_001507 [Actinomortierella ambigua]
MLQTNWETFHGQGCLGTNQTTPCYQGSVPVYTVKATSIKDIQTTVCFASKHNIRLAIKNTGHDFLGRSTAPSSISLWVTAMKRVEVVEAFVPKGAPSPGHHRGTPAVVVGPGTLWGEVYQAIDHYQRIVIGGDHPTVGAVGGLCLGGGHGPLSPRHGLCADNVLQYTVVTADGHLRIVNNYKHRELFWALRGGAPGFAVVVEAIYRTHPALQNVQYAQATILSEDSDSMAKVLRDFYARHEAWSSLGWSGYTAVRRQGMILQYFLPDRSTEQAQTSMQSFLDYARSLGPTVAVLNASMTEFPTFYAMLQGRGDPLFDEKTAGVNALLASRLIPRRLFQSDAAIDTLSLTLDRILGDLAQISPDAGLLLQFVAGGRVGAKGTATSKETSVHLAWRDALMLVVGAIKWDDNTPWGTQRAYNRKLTKSFGRLRRITPGGGSYHVEADPNEPDWQQAFFGTHYPRLLSVVDKYDPQGLFVCRRCVGSERWDDDLLCLQRK